MPINSIEDLKQKVGEERQIGACEIEKGTIQRFIRVIENSGTNWGEKEKDSSYSPDDNAEVPPTFLLTVGWEGILEHMLDSSFSGNLLHAGTELDCRRPIRQGDIISVTSKLTNLRERQGKTGRLVFLTFEITYINQSQEVIARCRQDVITQ